MDKLNFFDLLGKVSGISIEDDLQSLKDFFIMSNYDNYMIPENANEIERDAIRIMFDDKKDIIDRVYDATNIDPFCIEAFYLELSTRNESGDVNNLFMSYYRKKDEFEDLPPYSKSNYLIILDFFIEYLIDIHNITKAIFVQKDLMKISKQNMNRNTTRLCYLYFLLEECEDYYEFYQESEFKDPVAYMLLINTLLKHDQFDRAKIVLNDMITYVPFSNYIYRIWDLDESEVEAIDFKEAVESCYEELNSVPDFFLWCKENIEEVVKS